VGVLGRGHRFEPGPVKEQGVQAERRLKSREMPVAVALWAAIGSGRGRGASPRARRSRSGGPPWCHSAVPGSASGFRRRGHGHRSRTLPGIDQADGGHGSGVAAGRVETAGQAAPRRDTSAQVARGSSAGVGGWRRSCARSRDRPALARPRRVWMGARLVGERKQRPDPPGRKITSRTRRTSVRLMAFHRSRTPAAVEGGVWGGTFQTGRGHLLDRGPEELTLVCD